MPIVPAPDEPRQSDRAAGFAILAGLLLSLAFMAGHPIPRSHSRTEFVAEVTHLALSNSVVHGSLIACVGVLVAGYSGLAYRLGLASLVVRAGLVAYAIGAAGWVAAGLLNGFILPAFVTQYAGRPPGDLDAMRHIQSVGREANQASSRMAVLAVSVAVACWSLALGRRGFLATAVVGSIAAVLPASAVLTGHLAMDVHGMWMFLVCQVVWGGFIASLLIRGRV